MNETSRPNQSEIMLRAAYAEDALRPGGVLYGIAISVLAEPAELSPRLAGNILLPPRQPGEPKEARWQLIAGAQDAVKAAAEQPENESRILERATLLDLRREESLGPADITRIYPHQAVWVVEGGANRTSVVRRQLAIEAATAVYGADAGGVALYQFGSERPIPREISGKENPEYKIARDIAGNFLPGDDNLTEFGLNLASARQAGYEVAPSEPGDEAAARVVRLRKENAPLLVLVQPHEAGGGLEDGLESLSRMRELSGSQLVIATNGQYRAKDELQASKWARARDINILPPLALGDEPGYRVVHAGRELTTARRPAMAYLNEIVILERLS